MKTDWYKIYKFAQEHTGEGAVRQWFDVMRKAEKMGNMSLPKGFVYNGMEDFLSQHGVEYTSQPLTSEEIKLLRDPLENEWMYQVKQCYYNSQHIASGSNGKIQYVEGVAFCRLIPMSHAWNVINGKVVDFTWRKNGEPVLGIIPEGWEYIGVPFEVKREDMEEYIAEHQEVCSYLDDWRGGHQLYKKRFEENT